MNPSEMTDPELRLAIIEKLYGPSKGYDDPTYPNYPGDPAAAMGLLTGEFENWHISHSDGSDLAIGSKGFSVGIAGKGDEGWDLIKYYAESESLPRAISEAWLTARRNDG